MWLSISLRPSILLCLMCRITGMLWVFILWSCFLLSLVCQRRFFFIFLFMNRSLSVNRFRRFLFNRMSIWAHSAYIDKFPRPRVVPKRKKRVCSMVLTCPCLSNWITRYAMPFLWFSWAFNAASGFFPLLLSCFEHIFIKIVIFNN